MLDSPTDYSDINLNVGEITVSVIPIDSANPCVKVVFPDPKLPFRAMTVPTGTFFAIEFANCFVSLIEFDKKFINQLDPLQLWVSSFPPY